jgi:hypothetical protein
MRQQGCATVSSHMGSRTLRVLTVCASDIMMVVCDSCMRLVHSLSVLSSCVSREQISSSKIYIDDGHSLTSTDSGEQVHFPTGMSSSTTTGILAITLSIALVMLRSKHTTDVSRFERLQAVSAIHFN